VDATASSPVVKPTSIAPTHHLLRSAGINMTIWNVIPVGQKPARCLMIEIDDGQCDPPEAVSVDRIATRRTGIGRRVALRLWIVESGARFTSGSGMKSGIASRGRERNVRSDHFRCSPFWNCGIQRFSGNQRMQNKSVDATASSPVVKPTSSAPPHHL